MPRRNTMANPGHKTLAEVLHTFEQNAADGIVNVLMMPPPGTTINGLRVHIAALIERTKDNERKMVESVNDMALKDATREHEINELRQEVILLKSIVDKYYNEVESEVTDIEFDDDNDIDDVDDEGEPQ